MRRKKLKFQVSSFGKSKKKKEAWKLSFELFAYNKNSHPIYFWYLLLKNFGATEVMQEHSFIIFVCMRLFFLNLFLYSSKVVIFFVGSALLKLLLSDFLILLTHDDYINW